MKKLKKFIGHLFSILCIVFFIVITLFLGVLSLTSIIYSPGGKVGHIIMRVWSCSMLFFCRVKLHVHGIENIDRNKVQIFASSHKSLFDAFVLSYVLPVRFGYIAKKELFMVPIIGWHLKIMKHIFIDRSNREKAIESINAAAQKIRNGNRVTIFPEGTRSRDDELLPFKKGLFHLCINTGVPVVPIYIRGTDKVLKPGSLMVKSGDVFVMIGKEMPISNYTIKDIARAMMDLRSRLSVLKDNAKKIEMEI